MDREQVRSINRNEQDISLPIKSESTMEMEILEMEDLEDEKNPVPLPITRGLPKFDVAIPRQILDLRSVPQSLHSASEESNNSNISDSSDTSASSTSKKSSRYGKNVWSSNRGRKIANLRMKNFIKHASTPSHKTCYPIKSDNTSSVRNNEEGVDIMNLILGTSDVAVDATINRVRHFLVSGHVKLSPRQTIATCTAARKGKASYGYNLNSESSMISIWRFAAADLRNALFSSIANTYAVATFYDAEHAKVAKLLINGVHHVTEDGYCVPDIVNIGVGGKSTTSERLYESYADGVEGK